MRLYPVLDIKGGVVVHGRGGRRSSYRPIQSRLVESAEPLAVARAFRAHFQLTRLYLADLDAIAGKSPAAALLESLKAHGFDLLVDAGSRSADEAARLLALGVDEVVAPLETLPGPGALESIVKLAGPSRVVFSLDLKDGLPLGDRRAWSAAGGRQVARRAYEAGARRILLLDLARVGSGSGPAHLDLLELLKRELPGVEILTGGGIRSSADLKLIEKAGAAAALVATALHDGSIERLELPVEPVAAEKARVP
jgi:phosphoribosylformimino-5-aminoimidazole carboxamide ribotide isomerase